MVNKFLLFCLLISISSTTYADIIKRKVLTCTNDDVILIHGLVNDVAVRNNNVIVVQLVGETEFKEVDLPKTAICYVEKYD